MSTGRMSRWRLLWPHKHQLARRGAADGRYICLLCLREWVPGGGRVRRKRTRAWRRWWYTI
ncbi:MAG TPA: hypothetical protein VMU95_41160 [Trebonia sp.]|nr:hypothetical protein [Trebonia sp.]